jgi:hypothetical protein
MFEPPTPSYARASSYSASGDGARAAFLVLKRLGYRVERSFEPVGTLRAEPRTTTIVLASPLFPPSEQDRRGLRRFIERGGLIVTTGQGLAFLPGAPHVGSLAQRAAPSRRMYPAVVPSWLTHATPAIHVVPEVDAPGEPTSDATYVAAFADREATGVLTLHLGAGRAVWWIGSTPLQNDGIVTAGHLELLLSSLGPRDGRLVLWDEHYHGHARTLWSYLAATSIPAGFAQLALIGLAALATHSRRFGLVRALPVETRASAMEFVDALASVYSQAGVGASAVDVSRARLRRLMTTLTGLPATAPDALVADQTAARIGLDPARLKYLLAESQEASLGMRTAAGHLALVQLLQEAARAVRRAEGGTRLRRAGLSTE